MSRLARLVQQYRYAFLISASSLSILAYILLNPPFASSPFLPLGLEGDLDWYLSRYIGAFLFFGAIPLGLAYLLGFRAADLGLRPDFKAFRWPFYWLVFLVVTVTTVASVTDPKIASFYPYSKTLLALIQEESGFYFLAHALAYIILYYLPWEVFFRGILILPFVNAIEQQIQDESARRPIIMGIAAMQILPTVIIHYPHPTVELTGTLIFGVISAFIVLRTRSIYPVVLLHAAAGLGLETAIILTGP